MDNCPIEVHINDRFSEGPPYIYVGRAIIFYCWRETIEMGYNDIVVKCREVGYVEACKIWYYKLRDNGCIKTFNDYNVKKIWEEGENFGFLKTFIEFRDNNANMGENSNANTGIGKNNDANVG